MGANIVLGILGFVAVYLIITQNAWYWKICGWVIVLFVSMFVLTGVWEFVEPKIIKAREESRIAAEAREREELAMRAEAALKAQAMAKEDALRLFTLKEAPVLWAAYQNLQSALSCQDKKIEELRDAYENCGKNPDDDSDYARICSMRKNMEETLKTMRKKIEEAYIAACKYEATPGRKEYDEMRRKLLDDGIREAESAERRFDQMRKEK